MILGLINVAGFMFFLIMIDHSLVRVVPAWARARAE